MRFTVASIIALASAASAANVVVTNNLDSPVYLWSVGSDVGDRQTIEPGSAYTEEAVWDEQTQGRSVQVSTTENGYYDQDPIQIFAYTLETDVIWYNLYSANGNPFEGIRLTAKSNSGPTIDCENGICGDNNTKQGKSQDDIVFTIGA